jgi:hypothetical protein
VRMNAAQNSPRNHCQRGAEDKRADFVSEAARIGQDITVLCPMFGKT